MLRTTLALLLLAAPLGAQQTVELPRRDRALAGAPTTLLTVGREEGESWELLANVSGVDFDAQDNLYILDAGNHRVVVVDARGRLVRTLGRRGGGPGELLAPSALAVRADGTVAVADLGRGAFSVFAPDGSFRFNVPFADSLGLPGPEQRGSGPSLASHPQGVAVFGSVRITAGPEAPGAGVAAATVPLYVRPLAGRGEPRVLYRVPRQPPVLRSSGDENNRRVMSVPRLLVPQPAWALLPDGGAAVLHGTSPDYRIHVLDDAGRTTRVLHRPLPARRVTRDDQERARRQLAERMRAGTGMMRVEVRASGGDVQRSISTGGAGSRAPDERQIEEQLRAVQFGDVVPAVFGLRSDPRGRLWVARAPQRIGEDGAIDLLGADGRYLGTLAPQPLPDALSASGLAAYIVVDDLGVERVVVKRLPAQWR